MDSLQSSDSSEEVSKEEMSEEEKKKLLKSLRRKNIKYTKIESNFENKITNTKSVIHNLSEAKDLSQKKKEMNQLKKEIKDSKLMEIISDNQYQFIPERLIDIKKMIREIEEWFKNLRCIHKGCPNQLNPIIAKQETKFVNYHQNKTFNIYRIKKNEMKKIIRYSGKTR